MNYYMYLSCVRFSLQFIFCTALFCVFFARRKLFPVRVIACALVYFGAAYGLRKLLQLRIWGVGSNLAVMVLFYFFLFAMVLGWVTVCFDVAKKDALFAGVGGYTVQHLTYSIVTIVRYIIRRNGNPDFNMFWDNVLFRILPYIFVGVTLFIFLIRPFFRDREIKDRDLRLIFIAAVVLVSNVVLSLLSGEGLGAPINGFITMVVCKLYGIVGCVLCLFLLFGVTRWNRLERENEVMDRLLYMERSQHDLAKETIDIINMKCHDLKHQIAALKQIDNETERRETIGELEKTVVIYDSMVKTGNDALDLVLTEKSLICEKCEIKLSIIADGAKLSFMSKADICSLFGNALDNAIESVREAVADKRLISLRINAEGNMLFVHLDNYCARPPEFAGDLPLTTKADKRMHGYGVRSIRYITVKYGGDMRMSVSKNRFSLDLLFCL